MSQNKEFRELVGFVGQVKLEHCKEHVKNDANTDNVNGVEMGQTQQAGFHVDSYLADILEVPEEGVKSLDRHVNENEHTKNVKHSVDGNYLRVIEEGALHAQTRVINHAEDEDVPQQLQEVAFFEGLSVRLGFVIVVIDAHG